MPLAYSSSHAMDRASLMDGNKARLLPSSRQARLCHCLHFSSSCAISVLLPASLDTMMAHFSLLTLSFSDFLPTSKASKMTSSPYLIQATAPGFAYVCLPAGGSLSDAVHRQCLKSQSHFLYILFHSALSDKPRTHHIGDNFCCRWCQGTRSQSGHHSNPALRVWPPALSSVPDCCPCRDPTPTHRTHSLRNSRASSCSSQQTPHQYALALRTTRRTGQTSSSIPASIPLQPVHMARLAPPLCRLPCPLDSQGGLGHLIVLQLL